MSDLISRADAMGAVQDHFNDDGFKGYDDGQKMMDRIKALPSAEAVADRPTGEWIFNPKDAIDLMFEKPKCSKCGFESSDGGNFCPNCGAKMTKGGEEK